MKVYCVSLVSRDEDKSRKYKHVYLYAKNFTQALRKERRSGKYDDYKVSGVEVEGQFLI